MTQGSSQGWWDKSCPTPIIFWSEARESQKRNGPFGISLPKNMLPRLHQVGPNLEHASHEILRMLVYQFLESFSSFAGLRDSCRISRVQRWRSFP
jgi:hypothetical protein